VAEHRRGATSGDGVGEPRANDELRAGEEMFSLLVSQVVDYAIFLLDPRGNVASWNEGAQRIKGYTAAEIIGRHFSAFYPEEDARAGKPEFELEVADRTGRFEDEGWRVRKDGSMFYANVIITALRGAGGELRGYAKVTRDITDRRADEERQREAQRQEAAQLREHAERVARLERSKSDFLNLASHELRGPLTVVRGYVSMIEEGDLEGEKLREVAPVISGKLAQMELLVRQMLEAARLEHDRLELNTELFDLRAVARDQVREFRPLATRHQSLEADLPETPVYVVADRSRIGTIAANLIDNAIKYSIHGGKITVLVTQRDNHAFLSVQDHGIGIAPEKMAELFTRFGRIEVEGTRNIGGTGLGLYLSRQIARRHGGDILAESSLGKGSRFTLSLPRARVERSHEAAGSGYASVIPLHGGEDGGQRGVSGNP